MAYAYCIFCKTIDRNKIAGLLEMRLHVETLVPKIIQRKWVKGAAFEVEHEYLPGYLFMFSKEPIRDFQLIRTVSGIFRILGSRENNYQLTGQDLAFAKLMQSSGGVIGVQKAYRVGDQIQLVEGALSDVEGVVLRLDRRGRALVRFSFDNADVQSWVAIDLLKESVSSLNGKS